VFVRKIKFFRSEANLARNQWYRASTFHWRHPLCCDLVQKLRFRRHMGIYYQSF